MDKERKQGVAPRVSWNERHPEKGPSPTKAEVQVKVEQLNQKAKECEGQLVLVISRNWVGNRLPNHAFYSLMERYDMGTLDDPFIQIESGIGYLTVGVKEQISFSKHFEPFNDQPQKGPIRDYLSLFCCNLDRLAGQKKYDDLDGLVQKKLLEIVIGDDDVYSWAKDEVLGKHDFTEEKLEHRRKLRAENPGAYDNLGVNKANIASFQKLVRLLGKEFETGKRLKLPSKESYLTSHYVNSRPYIISIALEIKALLRDRSSNTVGLSKEEEQFMRRATGFLKRVARGKEILDNQENGLLADIYAITAFGHVDRAFEREPKGWDINRLPEYLQVLEKIKSGRSLQEIDADSRGETYNFFEAIAKTLFYEEMSESIEETPETNPLRILTNGRKRLQMNVWTRKDKTHLPDEEKKE